MYFADLEFSPYGTKSKKSIEERSEYIVNFLIEQDCKLIVVACNTATVNSISMLRSKYAIPIIGVEPAIKPAALESKSGVMGDTKFWASGCSNKTANSISRLWGQEINLSSRE